MGAAALVVAAVMLPPAAKADTAISATVEVNGQPSLAPVAALERGGTWYFQASGLLQALGLDVTEAAGSAQVTAADGNTRLGIAAGSTTAYVDGAALDLEPAPIQQDGNVFAPLALLGLLGAQPAWEPSGASLTVDDAGVVPAAAIAAASGGVQLFDSGGGVADAAPGLGLAPGDRIVTASDGSAQVRLSDGSLIDVAPGSSLELTDLGSGETAGSRVASFTLLVGRILARIFDLGGGLSQLTVNTPTAVIGDRGTTFLVDVAPSGATTADVLSGQVTLAGEGGQGAQVPVRADEQSVVASAGAPASPAAPVGGVAVDSWLASAVADARVAAQTQTLAPQQSVTSQQALLQMAAPTIQQDLNQLSGQPYAGSVTTTGGAEVELTGQAPATGGVAGAGGAGAPAGSGNPGQSGGSNGNGGGNGQGAAGGNGGASPGSQGNGNGQGQGNGGANSGAGSATNGSGPGGGGGSGGAGQGTASGGGTSGGVASGNGPATGGGNGGTTNAGGQASGGGNSHGVASGSAQTNVNTPGNGGGNGSATNAGGQANANGQTSGVANSSGGNATNGSGQASGSGTNGSSQGNGQSGGANGGSGAGGTGQGSGSGAGGANTAVSAPGTGGLS